MQHNVAKPTALFASRLFSNQKNDPSVLLLNLIQIMRLTKAFPPYFVTTVELYKEAMTEKSKDKEVRHRLSLKERVNSKLLQQLFPINMFG